MLRRLLAPLVTMLLGTSLVACGDDSPEGDSESSGAGLDSLTIDGEVGTNPEVTWDGEVKVDEVEVEVVTEGDGEVIEQGDSVLSHVWIGNGFTQEKALSTYDGQAPQLFTVDEAMLSDLFIQGLEGHPVGSRVAVAASAETAFGEAGNAQLGIANKDTVVAVIDLLSAVPEGPEGKAQQPPAWAPDLVGDEQAPTGLDFSGVPKPDDELKSAYLIEGTGDPVEKGQTIVADYMGQVYGAEQPFEESFSAQPSSFQIGVGGLVKGWDKTLVGAPIGSRVVMAVPPEFGYGKAGNEEIGVTATDTIYFVVDILAAR